MKRVALLVALALLMAPASYAVLGTTDAVPAATLLFPYFEVDLANASGTDTVLYIQNASASAGVVNVVIWTDRSVPVGSFLLYMTGYDMQRISLRDVIVNGNIPATGDDADDPSDTSNQNDGISNQGPLSQDINFPGVCGPLPPFTAEQRASMQAALTGQNSTLLGGCAGASYGDSIARGYVTADSTQRCDQIVPHSDPTYYTNVIDNRNIWLGDYEIVNPTTDREQSFTAVHVESLSCGITNCDGVNVNDPLYTTAGRYTFYGRYNGFTATDKREPLGTKWGATYIRNASQVIAWRDTKAAQSAFPCASTPAPFPMSQRIIAAYDTEEDITGLFTSTPFPEETSKVLIGGSSFPVPHKMGWAFMNLNEASTATPTQPSSDPTARQSFVQVVHYPEAWTNQMPLSFGFTAVQLGSAAGDLSPWGDPPISPPAASTPANR